MDLRQLLALPGVEEECVLRSPIGFLALHGGSQDRGTDQIARAAAERAGASYYAIIQPPTLRVHLTSRLHDPAHSATLRRFLDHVDLAISVHGFGREGFAVWIDPERGLCLEPYGPALLHRQTEALKGIIVGGLHPELVRRAKELMADHCPDFRVADERLRLGFHPKNPCNLPRHHGVQIELPPGLRGIGPFGERPVSDPDDGPAPVIDALVELAHHAAVLLDGTGRAQFDQI